MQLEHFLYDPTLALYLPMWKRDGGVIMSDDACGHACTVTGALWTPQGRSFDLVDDNISIPYHAAINVSGDITIATWVKLTTVGTTDRALFSNQVTASNSGCYLFVSSDQKAYFYTGNGVNWPGGPNTSTLLAATQWYSVLATRLNGVIQIYLDGRIDGSPSTRGLTGNTNISYIGRFAESASKWMGGINGETWLWGRGFGAIEAQRWHEATKWRYQ